MSYSLHLTDLNRISTLLFNSLQMTDKDKEKEENWRTGKGNYVWCVFFKKSRKKTQRTMMWCFLEIHKENWEHVGEEADILEDLGPADVRVLLQAEEELSQVTFVLSMFRSLYLQYQWRFSRLMSQCFHQISLPPLFPVPTVGESFSHLRNLSSPFSLARGWVSWMCLCFFFVSFPKITRVQ